MFTVIKGDKMFSVIFDMDGTLLDTQKIFIPAWEYAGLNQGIKGVGNDIQNVCGMNKAGWTEYLNSHYPTMDTDKFNSEMRQYVTDNLVVKFMAGAEALLKYLKQKGIKIALASGSSMESVKHHLKEVSATEYFDAIVSGEEVENGKPAPDIFLLTAKRLGVAPKDCFVFEDSANGIRSAYGAGMKCIGIPDIVDFPDEVNKLLFAKLKRLDEAIAVFDEIIK